MTGALRSQNPWPSRFKIEEKLRAVRAIRDSEREWRDVIRNAIAHGIPIAVEVDGRPINIQNLSIVIDMRTIRDSP